MMRSALIGWAAAVSIAGVALAQGPNDRTRPGPYDPNSRAPLDAPSLGLSSPCEPGSNVAENGAPDSTRAVATRQTTAAPRGEAARNAGGQLADTQCAEHGSRANGPAAGSPNPGTPQK